MHDPGGQTSGCDVMETRVTWVNKAEAKKVGRFRNSFVAGPNGWLMWAEQEQIFGSSQAEAASDSILRIYAFQSHVPNSSLPVP